MAKVYPERLPRSSAISMNTKVLTVWKKSLMFNCDGYTVFDSLGNLVYRVDNYVPGGINGEILLMDASGHSLLTIRRKRISLLETWLVYVGETNTNPQLSVTKHVNIRNKKSLAYVRLEGRYSWKNNHYSSNKKGMMMYDIEGSYPQRCFAVYDDMRSCVADIKHKEAKEAGVALGRDVFQLEIVQPLIDPDLAMALIIILDQMFGSSARRYFV